MKYFNTLNDFINYVPQCIICKKGFKYLIDGMFVGKTNNSNKLKNLTIKLSLRDNQLISTGYYNVVIDPITNKIIDGTSYIKKISNSYFIDVIKYCSTCVFRINARCITSPKMNTQNITHCPILYLSSESLNFTLKGGKSCKIYNYYYGYNHKYPGRASIVINNKSLEASPINFSHFLDKNHLLKRLTMLMVFQ